MSESNPRIIQLEDDREAEYANGDDYFFEKIGSVPLSTSDTVYDPQSPPVQPLAISEKHGLVFLAHLSGFIMARTKEVVDLAKDIKEKGSNRCIKDLCVVDVHIGKVDLLVLSGDSDKLAACVGGDVQFFMVNSLINKDQKPFHTCSIGESEFARDMKWLNKMGISFLVLSDHGSLYLGVLGGALRKIMEDVDAVDLSIDGKMVAVARKTIVSILSIGFKEILRMSLSFKSWTDDADVSSTIKVDSIRWIRRDCIVLGCYQLGEDGSEENYLVQAISTKGVKFTDASSQPAVLSFFELFPFLIDDAVPFGGGPYLLLSYLDKCDIAFTANKKNPDDLGLIGWSKGDEEDEVAVIPLVEDTWLPRFDLSENGCSNLVMGLCIDKVSSYDQVRVNRGAAEYRELSPACVLYCLTLEGKLFMYHFASDTETPGPPSFPEEDDYNPSGDLVGHDLSINSEEQELEGVNLHLQTQYLSRKDFGTRGGEIPGKINLADEKKARSLNSEDVVTNNLSVTQLQSTSTWEADGRYKPHGLEQYRAADIQLDKFGQQDRNTFHLEESQSIVGVGSETVSFMGRYPCDTAALSSNTGLQKVADSQKELLRKAVPVESESRTVPISTEAIESLPSFRSSLEGKLPIYSLDPVPKNYIMRQLPGQQKLEPKFAKHYENIKDMTMELDTLLEYIEDSGGFREACTVMQKGSVEALEHGIQIVSEKTSVLKRVMDEQLEEIQHLLDKTIQVLARKIYMEGIVKQANDSQYWDLWDRQKLSSELELKRQHILKVNQELTNQLIELERHFHTLELNKFSQDGKIKDSDRVFRNRFAPSRNLQSLQILTSTMNSQLTAAEQLSQCLSKQMAALSVESPPVKHNSVKRDLFETIGITYDDASFNSPEYLSNKKFALSSDSGSVKDRFGKSQSSSVKLRDPETARRRRDSLDKSWVSFEPPKTTVKRCLLQEAHKVNVNSSSLAVDRQSSSIRLRDRSVPSHQNARIPPSTFYPSTSEDILDYSVKHGSRSPSNLFKQANNFTGPLQPVGSDSTRMPGLQNPALPFTSAPRSSPVVDQTHVKETGYASPGSWRSSIGRTEEADLSLSDRKSNHLSGAHSKTSSTSLGKLPSQTLSSHYKTSDTSTSNSKDLSYNKSSQSSSFEFNRTHGSLPTLSSAFSTAPSHGNSLRFDSVKNKSQSSENVSSPLFPAPFPPVPSPSKSSVLTPSSVGSLSSAVSLSISNAGSAASSDGSQVTLATSRPLSALSASLPSSSFSLQITTSAMSLSVPPVDSKVTSDASKVVSTISQSMFASSGSMASSALAFHVPTSVEPSVSSTSDSLQIKPVSPTSTIDTTTETPESQPGPPGSKAGFNLTEPPALTGTEAHVQTGVASGNQPILSGATSPLSHGALNNEKEEPPATPIIPAETPVPSDAFIMKAQTSDNVITQEDEMEEEAPETNLDTDISLGGLGGFGLGTAATPASAPKTNPFGGPLLNATSNPVTSSPFSMTNPSGGLFRPASFSFSSSQTQPSQQTGFNTFSGGFGTSAVSQTPSGSGFGQPAQMGQGQQALGSVLGAFGQSRQLGTGSPGSGFAAPSGFGGGFSTNQSAGGFANAATAGGFAGVGSTSGGFAGVGSTSGGFAALASGAGGFAAAASASGGGGFGAFGSSQQQGSGSSGGFGAFGGSQPQGSGGSGGGFGAFGSQQQGSGGGFGAFGSQQGSGGFSAFGSTAGGSANPPSQLFTQMRK